MTAQEPCSNARLPVYEVVGTGIDDEQARRLAQALGIPPDKLLLRNGEASFVDPARYLAVPVVQVADRDLLAAERDATVNHCPEIPIEVTAVDHRPSGCL